MSQPFEYGGIDREPVSWVKQQGENPSTHSDPAELPASLSESIQDLHSDIEYMLITQ